MAGGAAERGGAMRRSATPRATTSVTPRRANAAHHDARTRAAVLVQRVWRGWWSRRLIVDGVELAFNAIAAELDGAALHRRPWSWPAATQSPMRTIERYPTPASLTVSPAAIVVRQMDEMELPHDELSPVRTHARARCPAARAGSRTACWSPGVHACCSYGPLFLQMCSGVSRKHRATAWLRPAQVRSGAPRPLLCTARRALSRPRRRCSGPHPLAWGEFWFTMTTARGMMRSRVRVPQTRRIPGPPALVSVMLCRESRSVQLAVPPQ